jgi:DNA-directed RNA polymerase beta subunit
MHEHNEENESDGEDEKDNAPKEKLKTQQELIEEAIREMFTRQEKNFLANLKLIKEDIRQELKQSEFNKLQQIS